MKKAATIISIFSLVAFSFFGAFSASASTTDWADAMVNFTQGNQKDGDPVDASRSDPNNALGADDDVFVSLGYGGEIVLGFPTKGVGTLSVASYEITTGPYPEEKADVYVSSNGTDWVMAGTAYNEEGVGDGITEIAISEDMCVQYVKLIDTTDGSLHDNNSDGYDVDAVSFTYDRECPEDEPGDSEGNDTVVNNNTADVYNHIRVMANTGRNWAGGSYGGEGGNGGDVYNKYGDGDVEDSTTGAGGSGGSANSGGTIVTGNATSALRLVNDVNHNLTEIDRCACESDIDGNVRVRNLNLARLVNEGEVAANTGENMADGSFGGEAGGGGDIKNYGDGDVEDSDTGAGGSGGNSGLGGYIETGNSFSRAEVVNTINRNITRVRR